MTSIIDVSKQLDDTAELAYYESDKEDIRCSKTFYEINVRHNTCFRVSIAIYMTVTCHTVRARHNV